MGNFEWLANETILQKYDKLEIDLDNWEAFDWESFGKLTFVVNLKKGGGQGKPRVLNMAAYKCPIFNPCYKFLPERVLIVWMIIEWDFIAQMDQMMKDVDW